jgi:hypothetical protein
VTQNQERVAAIVSIVAPQLKRAGFRKRRNSFNREVADGIVHVVSLQLGSYDPSGKFTINLGVFVPGLNQVSSGSRGPWVNEYDCDLRWRIGELHHEGRDLWWGLDDQAGVQVASDLLLTAGLERLGKFDSVAALLAAFDRDGGKALGMAPRAPLDIGALHAKLGDRDRAHNLFSAYVDALLAKSGTSSHWPVAAKIVRENGFSDIADRLHA